MVLESKNTVEIIDTLQNNLNEVDDEIDALSTIRSILDSFITKLNDNIKLDLKVNLLDDSTVLEIADSLTIARPKLKEEKTSEDLEKAERKMLKLTDRDVRIVYLPPMTLASIHIIGQDENGEHAEYTSAHILEEFIKKVNLKQIYPAARNFGFNNPDGISDDDPNHGYERWISIPDDMEVPAPLVKKQLDGGLYAAHVIPMGAWDEGWMPLYNWIDDNDRYDGRWGTVDGVCGWLEEHLNFWNWNVPHITQQVDLLMPIKNVSDKDIEN